MCAMLFIIRRPPKLKILTPYTTIPGRERRAGTTIAKVMKIPCGSRLILFGVIAASIALFYLAAAILIATLQLQ